MISKKENIEKMKELNLNFFPLQVFDVKNLDGIKDFFDQNSAEEYVLRTVEKAKGAFFYVSNFKEAKEKLEEFHNEVAISVSYRPYKEKIVLVGDINISKVEDDFVVDLIARSDAEATNRNIYEKPQYNFHTDLKDETLWQVDGVDKIIRYVAEKGLTGYIVEFAVYDCEIGINKECVVISEIRKDY